MSDLQTRRSFVKSLAISTIGLLAAACGQAAPPSGAPTNVAPATVGSAATKPPAAAPTTGAAPTAVAAATQAPAGPNPLATAIAQAVSNNPSSGPARFGPPPPGVPQVPQTGVAAGTGGPAPQPKGNRLVVAVGRPVRESNNTSRGADTYLGAFHFEQLVGLDYATGSYVGHLAEKWQVEPNGKDVRFFIRKGVPFHNNMGEVTAEDVKFTYETITAPGPTNNFLGSTIKEITGEVKIINPYEVVWIGNKPDALLWWYQSQATAGGQDGVISKKDFDSRGGTMPAMIDVTNPPLAGTGPWQFKSRTQGQNIVFEKVPYKHWRVDADFRELELRFFAEPAAKLSALLAGDIGITQLTRDQRDLAVSRGMKLFRGKVVSTGAMLQFIGSYPNDPDNKEKGYKYPDSPIMKLNVRKALSKAVNKDEINKLFKNEGVPMWLGDQLEGQVGWDPEWITRYPAEYGYDPAAAKALLAQEGYGPNNALAITLELYIASIPEANDVIEAVAGMWNAVGVNATIESLDPGTFVKKLTGLEFNNHAYIEIAGGVQPWVLSRGETAHFVGHGWGFEDFEFESAIFAAWSELDAVKQDALTRKAYDIQYTRHAHIPLYYLYQEVVADPKVVSAFDYAGNATFYHFTPLIRAA